MSKKLISFILLFTLFFTTVGPEYLFALRPPAIKQAEPVPFINENKKLKKVLIDLASALIGGKAGEEILTKQLIPKFVEVVQPNKKIKQKVVIDGTKLISFMEIIDETLKKIYPLTISEVLQPSDFLLDFLIPEIIKDEIGQSQRITQIDDLNRSKLISYALAELLKTLDLPKASEVIALEVKGYASAGIKIENYLLTFDYQVEKIEIGAIDSNTLDSEATIYEAKTMESLYYIALGNIYHLLGNEYYELAHRKINLADYQKCLDYFHKAVESYQKAIKINPENPKPYYSIGRSYFFLENPETAMKYLKEAQKRGLPNANNLIGDAYAFNLGNPWNYWRAFIYYRKAIKENPTNPLTLNNFGRIYSGLGQHQTAEKYFNKAVVVAALSGNQLILDLAFSNLVNIKRELQLIEDYQRKTKISKNPEDHFKMGESYAKLGDKTQAIKCYKKAIELNPKYFQSYLDLVTICDDLHKYKEAIRTLNQALKYCEDKIEKGYLKNIRLLLIKKRNLQQQFKKPLVDLLTDRFMEVVRNIYRKIIFSERIDKWDEKLQKIMQGSKINSFKYIIRSL